MSNESIAPEHFGHSFLKGDPAHIYDQCIEEFQNIITRDQFKELVHSFNENVDGYQICDF